MINPGSLQTGKIKDIQQLLVSQPVMALCARRLGALNFISSEVLEAAELSGESDDHLLSAFFQEYMNAVSEDGSVQGCKNSAFQNQF